MPKNVLQASKRQLIDDRLYEILCERWRSFSIKYDSMRRSTDINRSSGIEDSALTGWFVYDQRDKVDCWHDHLRRLGMKLTYPRGSSRHHYVRDPGQIYTDSPLVEIGREDAIKIITLGHIP